MFVMLAASLFLISDPSSAIPRYPIDELCDVRARGWHANGPANPGGRNTCISQEQQAYAEARHLWQRTDPDLRERCATSGYYMRSYQFLAGCLYQLVPAQEQRGNRHFHY